MLRAVRFCLMIEGQEGVTWDRWVALADAADRLGFEALFRSDHYFSARGVTGRGSTDAWTLLGALAARTRRIRLGTLVSPVTFRHPSLLAKAAATVDQISGGRVEIGMGAGWWAEEHTQYGFPFPPVSERFAMLEEQLEIVHGLLTEERFSFHGKHYTLDAADLLPKTIQRPRPPIILGGTRVGPWMRRLIGRWANEFNTVGGTPDQVRRRLDRARAGAGAAGRDPDALVTSLMTWCLVGETEREYLTRLRRTHAVAGQGRSFGTYRDQAEAEFIVGAPERAAERLTEYVAAGVERIMLNHSLFDDLQMLELLATQVVPQVGTAGETGE